MAYKDMNTVQYLILTISLYAAIVVLAMLAPSDIGGILDIVSAYSISCFAFFVPAVFYIKALDKFKLVDKNSKQAKCNMLISYFLIAFGSFNAAISLLAAAMAFLGLH